MDQVAYAVGAAIAVGLFLLVFAILALVLIYVAARVWRAIKGVR